jgi:hypothetical protein
METPTIEGLKEVLEDLNLTRLISQLDERSFKRWKNRTEAQWERRFGDAGIDIFNYLHPSEGIEDLI